MLHAIPPSTGRTRFVILFEHRSGSTYLTEGLDAHPQVRAEKEHLAALREQIDQGNAEPAEQLEWVQQYFAECDKSAFAAVGFKTKYRDVFDLNGLADVLRQLRCRIILLQRRNRIKLLVSLINAMRLKEVTGDWNLYDAHHRQGRLTIDVPQFCDWLEQLEKGNRRLQEYTTSLALPTLDLYYEEILADEPETFGRVCQFLNVPYLRLRGNSMKHTSDDLREVVNNFDELRGRFIGTRYEEMFDEVLAGKE